MEYQDLSNKFYSNHPIKRANIRNAQWEYICSGKGNIGFLIFPGALQTAQSNFNFIKTFEKEYKVIAFTVNNVDSIEEFCFAINKILAEEKINKIILYGLSLGGLLAQSYTRRNREKVKALIISHACAPTSKIFFRKIIIPFKIVKYLFPFIPSFLVKNFAKKFTGKIQGSQIKTINFDTETLTLYKIFSKECFNEYLNKQTVKTIINLSLEFYCEKFTAKDLEDWKGKILILRTDNDPLMQDEGEFKKIYPRADIITFTKSGHLTFYYQFEKMVRVISDFLGKI